MPAKRQRFLLCAALWATSFVPGLAQDADLSSEESLSWLRSLMLEARVGLTYEADFTRPRLFTEQDSTGQNWITNIRDALSGDWASLDQAVTLLLQEADYYKAQASKETDATLQTHYHNARKDCLSAAALLLEAYEASTASLTGSLGSTLPQVPTGLSLPSAIELKKLSGAARLNTKTGAFNGQLSGDLALPGFDTALTVPSLSFDSAGNISLTAYGQTRFPPTGSETVTFSVDQRKPLALQIGSDGTVAAQGTGSLLLPDGNRFDASFAIDDPEYAFGLAFSGNYSFDLAKELTLIRPVVDFDSAEQFSFEALEGLAQVWGGLGTGMESFVRYSQDLPDIASVYPGEAPEKTLVESTVPLDVWGAWLTAVGNEQIVSRLNGSTEASAARAKSFFEDLATELEEVRSRMETPLSQIKQINRHYTSLKEAREKLVAVNSNEALSEAEQIELSDNIEAAYEKAYATAKAIYNDLPADTDLRVSMAAFRSLAALAGEMQQMNLTVDLPTNDGVDQAFVATVALMESKGVDFSRSPENGKYDALDDSELRWLRFLSVPLAETFSSLGGEAENAQVLAWLTEMSDLQLSRTLTAFERARETGDWPTLAETGVELGLFGSAWVSLISVDVETESRLQYITIEASTELSNALGVAAANKLLESTKTAIGDRDKALFAEVNAYLATEVDGLFTREYTLGDAGYIEWLLTSYELALEAVQAADFDPEQPLVILRSLLESYLSQLTTQPGNIGFIEDNFTFVYQQLNNLTHGIARLEALLPGEGALLAEFTNTWQPLHLQWLGVAEAQQATWYLSAYTQNIATLAQQYAGSLSNASLEALRSGAVESATGLQNTVNSLAGLFSTLDAETFTFALPADLRLRRLSGELAFNRLSHDWAFRFGGDLWFPQEQARFAIPNASLDSSGSFNLSLLTRGPLPFGPEDGQSLRIDNAFALSGNVLTPSILGANAAGTLLVENGGSTDEFSVGLAYNYDGAADLHNFGVTGSAADSIEVFTEDLVLFRTGLGFDLSFNSEATPTQAGLNSAVSAGILRRPESAGKEVGALTKDDFHLNFVGESSVVVNGEATTVTLGPGTLEFGPEFIAKDCLAEGAAEAAGRPNVAIPAGAPFVLTYRTPGHSDPALRDSVAFSGAVGLSNLRFSLPDVPWIWLDVCSAQLDLGFDSTEARPTAVLSNLEATASFLLPNDQRARAQLEVAEWSLDRLPTDGAFFLRGDLKLYEESGFTFAALGSDRAGEDPVTGVFFTADAVNGGGTLLFQGGFEAKASGWFKDGETGEAITASGRATGSLSIDAPADPAELDLSDFSFDIPTIEVAIDGDVRLGDENAIELVDPKLAVTNPLRALNPSSQNPFILNFDFGLRFTNDLDYSFSLYAEQARILFDGSAQAPLFDLGEFGGCLERNDLDEQNGGSGLSIVEGLPFYLDKVCLSVANLTSEPVPLLPDPESFDPGVFNQANIELTLSAGLNLPEDNPIFTGAVEDLVIGFDPTTGRPKFSLDGFAVGLDGNDIPPVNDIAGKVYLGGLSDPGPNGENLFFAGQIKAKVAGTGVEGLLAFNRNGPIGLCLSADAPTGIPLGPTPFVLNGASGGLSFANSNGDPCDFRSFISLDAEGKPTADSSSAEVLSVRSADTEASPKGSNNKLQAAMSWEQLAAEVAATRQLNAWLAEYQAQEVPETQEVQMASSAMPQEEEAPSESMPCPTGDCPTPSLNLFCQPHPDAENYPDRAILRLTAIDLDTLDPSAFPALASPQAVIEEGWSNAGDIAAYLAAAVRLTIEEQMIAQITSAIPDSTLAGNIETELLNKLDQAQALAESAMREAIAAGLAAAGVDLATADTGDAEAVYAAIRDAAYRGLDCPDITMKLTGTVSLATSAAISGEAGVVLSSAGAAGIVGEVAVAGIPLGDAEYYAMLTDEEGNIAPSLCGNLTVKLGPIRMGGGAFALDYGVSPTDFVIFVAELGDCLSTDAINAALRQVGFTDDREHLADGGAASLLQLNEDEAMAFIASLLSNPPAEDFASCAAQKFVTLIDSINPELSICADGQPSLFGLPIGPEGGELRMFVSKENFAGQVPFRPAQMIGNIFTAGYASALWPPIDSAELGFRFGMPAPEDLLAAGFGGTFATPSSAQRFFEDGFNDFLTEGIITLDYSFNPLGIEFGQAQGRVIFPDFIEHPAVAGADWVSPDQRSGLPARRALLLQATRTNLLGDLNWLGDRDDLGAIYPEGSSEAGSVAGLELRRDYFPHGGILGGSTIKLPALFVDAPETELFEAAFGGDLLNDPTPWTRLEPARQFLFDYLLALSEVGNLAFYIPAPNPPASLLTGTEGQMLQPQDFMDAILDLDPAAIESNGLFPREQVFFYGELESRLFGIPLGQGTLTLESDSGSANPDPYLLITADIPSDSWIRDFVDNASAEFFLRGAPSDTLSEMIEDQRAVIDPLIAQGSSAPDQAVLDALEALNIAIANRMPKMAMELEVNQLTIPVELASILSVSGDASALFAAYSPLFDAESIGETPLAKARRLGGYALRGNLSFLDRIDIDNAELAVYKDPLLPLPRFAGNFDVPYFEFAPNAGLHDFNFAFDSGPNVGAAYLEGSGQLDPISLGGVLTLQPLDENASRLTANASFIRAADDAFTGRLAIHPARLAMPLLGPSLEMVLHGPSESDPFEFDTDGPWENATVTARGSIDLLAPDQSVLVRIGNPGNAITASASGNGFNLSEITFDLTLENSVTFLPGTDAETVLPFGRSGAASLTLRNDGSFAFTGLLDDPLGLDGLPIAQIESNASIEIDENGLILSGSLSGGTVNDLGEAVSSNGSLSLAPDGALSLSGSLTMQPLDLGVFTLSGTGGGNVTVEVITTETTPAEVLLSLPAGARLDVPSMPESNLTVSPFTIDANGDFSVTASGHLQAGEAWRLSGGSFELQRLSGLTAMAMTGPNLRLFPGNPDLQQDIALPLETLTLNSAGRLYYDSGTQNGIQLPAGLSASGRLEFGFEPDSRTALFQKDKSSLAFGTQDIETERSQTVEVTNPLTALAQLQVTASVTGDRSFRVIPSGAQLSPGESRTFTVLFDPQTAGSKTATLSFAHNASGSPDSVSLSGTGFAEPVYRQSTDALDFGAVALYGTAEREFYISNEGIATMPLSFTVDAPFSVYLPPSQVDPGESERVRLRYRPTDLTTASATLTISVDGSTVDTIALTGAPVARQWAAVGDQSGLAIDDIVAIDFANIDPDNDGSYMYAVTRVGTIKQSYDNGRSVNTIRSFADKSFNDIWINDSSDTSWIVGEDGAVLHMDEFDWQWDPVDDLAVTNPERDWNGVTVMPNGRPILVGGSGSTARIAWQDSSGDFQFNAFTQKDEASSDAELLDIAIAQPFSNQNSFVAVACGLNGTVYLGTGSTGDSWSLVEPENLDIVSPYPNLYAVDVLQWFGGEDYATIAVGENGTVLRHVSFQSSWTKLNVPTTETLRDVIWQGSTIWIVGDNDTILRSTNNGGSWTSESTGVNADLISVDLALNGDLLVGSEDGRFFLRPAAGLGEPLVAMSEGYFRFGPSLAGEQQSISTTIRNEGGRDARVVIEQITGDPDSPLVFHPEGETLLPAGTEIGASMNYFPTQADSFEYVAFSIKVYEGDTLLSEAYFDAEGSAYEDPWRRVSVLPNEEDVVAVAYPDANTIYAATIDQLFRSDDLGETWTDVSTPAWDSGTFWPSIQTIAFSSATKGWVGGANGGFYTDDGGDSWTPASGLSAPVTHLSFDRLFGSPAYALSDESIPQLRTGSSTTFKGKGWLPFDQYEGRGVAVPQSGRGFVIDASTIYTSPLNTTPSFWSTVTTTDANLNAIAFGSATYGLVAGDNGYFARTSQGGEIESEWVEGRIEGYPDLKFAAAESNVGYLARENNTFVLDGSPLAYRIILNSGATTPELFVPGFNDLGDIALRRGNSSRAVAGLENGQIWLRDTSFERPATPMIDLPVNIYAGELPAGQTNIIEIPITNRGNAPLILSGVTAGLLPEQAALVETLTVNFTPTELAPGASTLVPVILKSDFAFDGRLLVGVTANDTGVFAEGSSTLSAVEFSIVGSAVNYLSLSAPAEAAVSVDGVSATGTLVLPVTAGGTGESLAPGSMVTIAAAASYTVKSSIYEFQTWREDLGFGPSGIANLPSFDYTIPESGAQLSAIYSFAGLVSASSKTTTSKTMLEAQSGTTPPDGIPGGPWLKLSNASLNIPQLGNFNVAGDLFLSATQIDAALSTSELRLPKSTSEPELLHIEPNSLQLSYRANPFSLTLAAETSGVRLLGTRVSIDSNSVFNWTQNGGMQLDLSTEDDFYVIPYLMKLGPVASDNPAQIQLAFDGDLTLALNGRLSALPAPNGEWMVDTALPTPLVLTTGDFSTRIEQPTLPSTLLDLGFLQLTTDSSSAIILARNEGVLSIDLDNLDLSLFGVDYSNLEPQAAAASDGSLSFTLPDPAGHIPFGPFLLDPQGALSLDYEGRTGRLTVAIPETRLKADDNQITGWPSSGVPLNQGFTVDSQGDFEHSFALPTFSFAGITIGSALDPEADPSENHLKIWRRNGVFYFEVLDKRELNLNGPAWLTTDPNLANLTWDLTIGGNSTGAFNASYAGTFSSWTPVGDVLWSSVALSFDPENTALPFVGYQSFLGQSFVFRFGPSGLTFNHLICNPGDSFEECGNGLF